MRKPTPVTIPIMSNDKPSKCKLMPGAKPPTLNQVHKCWTCATEPFATKPMPAINANKADKPTEPTPIMAATFSGSLLRPAAKRIKPMSGNNTVKYK
ncbi:hypothetical protein D3C86_1990670 [compost metagenome]